MDQMSESNGAQSDDYPAQPSASAPAQGKGLKICIYRRPDGMYLAYKEDAAEEMREGEASPGGEQGQPYDNPQDAFRAAFEILKENPQGESEQSSFDAGFAGKGPKA